jgi:hypothetical protein
MGSPFSQEHRLLANSHVDKGGRASANDRRCMQGGDLEGPPRDSGEHTALRLGQVTQAQSATMGSQGRGGSLGPGAGPQV